MKKIILLLVFFISCTHFGQLTLVRDLSTSLNEVSGNEIVANSELIWMVNDSGNAPEVFGVNKQGGIEKVVKVTAKNHDWEDLTSDEVGNLYIGDFGNNQQKRKKLGILKIANKNLLDSHNVSVEKINFVFPTNSKNKKVSYDIESFFYHNNYFYLFTKSRKKKKLGKTRLFKVPNIIGKHEALLISEFNFCNQVDCRITGADISNDGEKVVLLNHESVIVLTNFKKDNFFSGTMSKQYFDHVSQKEGICFKNNQSVYITDEYSRYTKGNLYEYTLNN